jgi:uncharacterized membrane protein YhaH (DUF805 family)
MPINTSRKPLILIIIALFAVSFLAVGLSNFDFRPGSLFEPKTLGELKAILQNRDRILNLILVVLILVPFLLLLFSRRSNIRNPADGSRRSGLLSHLLRIALWIVVLMIVRQRIKDRQLSTNMLTLNPVMKWLEVTPAQVSPSTISDGWAFLISFALIFTFILILWVILRRRNESIAAIEFINQEAQAALREIRSGAAPHDVILRCYYEMNKELSERKGIQRKEGMTPREFENRLIELGFPEEPVKQLTRLFELVRYGAKSPGQDFENQAVNCLSAIIKGIGRTK